MKTSYWVAGLLGASALLAQPALAEEKPLWEIGLGAAGVTFPDYRGSDRQSGYVLPMPYFVYRGEHLKADRNGMRASFFDNDRLDINLSLAASLPVNSKDNSARVGMPDLKPTIEIGPSFDVTLWQSKAQGLKLDLRLPIRAAITLESSPKYVGWVFSPRVNLDVNHFAGVRGLNLGILAGPLFADRKNNAYTYSVEAPYATATRPAYEAGGGYAGAQVTTALSKRFDKVWVGAFARYDNLSGAHFADSPLVKRKHAYSAGLAASWVFGESATKVDASE